jgi:hypothetical protein
LLGTLIVNGMQIILLATGRFSAVNPVSLYKTVDDEAVTL